MLAAKALTMPTVCLVHQMLVKHRSTLEVTVVWHAPPAHLAHLNLHLDFNRALGQLVRHQRSTWLMILSHSILLLLLGPEMVNVMNA